MLGTFNARGFVDRDAQSFASAVKAVGEQAGIHLVQRVVGIVQLGLLGHGEFILFCVTQARSIHRRGLQRPGSEPDLKNI